MHNTLKGQSPRTLQRIGLFFDPLSQRPRLASVVGLALIALLVLVVHGLDGSAGPLAQSIPLLFLVPVLVSSALGGRWPGVLVAILAIATWDWFFIPPLYTVTVASVRDVLALAIFLGVALFTGHLSNALRRRTVEALRRARSSEALYDLSMALIARHDLAEVLPSLTLSLRDTFDLESCAILLPDTGPLGWRTAARAGPMPRDLVVEDRKSVAAVATWVHAEGRPSGLGRVHTTETQHGYPVFRPRLGEERAQFLPLRVGPRPVGVLELVYHAGRAPDQDRDLLLATFANGAALALEQQRLAEEEHAAAVARESDRLKSALLSSVSHDLRTPLAGIKAAASSLLQEDVQWNEEDRRAFITDIDAEADRLTRLVSNLLDLSRIEAGALKPRKEWVDVAELIARVVRRQMPHMGDHPVRQDIAEALPAVRLDAVQIEQALTNLLENAAKYSPAGTPVVVGARIVRPHAQAPELHLFVSDHGVGIATAEQTRIFDKFYRVAGSARRAAGTGMGLAIVKGLAEAHGGTVLVDSVPGQGSTFTITLPLDEAASPDPEDRISATPTLQAKNTR